MKKLLLVLLLLTATNAHAEKLMAIFPSGAVVIKGSICTLDELVDDYPYHGYAVTPKGVVTDGCWVRGKSQKTAMIVFIEKVKKDRYKYNKIESKYFK